jgi:hypothetical protein
LNRSVLVSSDGSVPRLALRTQDREEGQLFGKEVGAGAGGAVCKVAEGKSKRWWAG